MAAQVETWRELWPAAWSTTHLKFQTSPHYNYIVFYRVRRVPVRQTLEPKDTMTTQWVSRVSVHQTP